MNSPQSVTVTELINQYGYKNLTPQVDTDKVLITVSDVNRPSLQLTGFFVEFDPRRVQIMGTVERAYLSNFTEAEQVAKYRAILERGIPCLIYDMGFEPSRAVLDEFVKNGVVALLSEKENVLELVSEVNRWLKVKLAPTISVHGVLMDVFGEGVLIMGESGIGKSEAALELIKRGHRLVSDDLVEIRKVSEATLIGTAPDITKHFIELRGIGIIDVKALYGVECVKDTANIDMVIQLEDWDKDKEYDRLGLNENTIEFMGIHVKCHVLPIRPGRNLAIICETAAVNHRQQKMGYNAAQELYNRVQASIEKGLKGK